MIQTNLKQKAIDTYLDKLKTYKVKSLSTIGSNFYNKQLYWSYEKGKQQKVYEGKQFKFIYMSVMPF